MVRHRLITLLTFNDGVLFRTKNFLPDYRYTANFVDAWSVDEIVLVDVTPPGEGDRSRFFEVVGEFADRCFVPLCVGGKVRCLEDFAQLLRVGADKILVTTGAFTEPSLIAEAARIYGSQCVVVGVDVYGTDATKYEVFSHNGRCGTGRSPTDWARYAVAQGAGELLVTSIEKDGSLEGYDNALVRSVAGVVDVPVLASGGAGKWQDFVDGIRVGGASGVCTSCIYHFTETSIKSAKRYLRNSGIDVR